MRSRGRLEDDQAPGNLRLLHISAITAAGFCARRLRTGPGDLESKPLRPPAPFGVSWCFVVGGAKGRLSVDRGGNLHPIDAGTPATRGHNGALLESFAAKVEASK